MVLAVALGTPDDLLRVPQPPQGLAANPYGLGHCLVWLKPAVGEQRIQRQPQAFRDGALGFTHWSLLCDAPSVS